MHLTFLICFTFLLINRCFADLRQSYSMIQYGHKLDKRMITPYDKYSIPDCVEDCLRTTRCRSVNYHQGAHFCQTNFEDRTNEPDLLKEKPGMTYSNIEGYDIAIGVDGFKSNYVTVCTTCINNIRFLI